MFAFSLLLIPICLAKDLPETKHLRGGIFSWPNALAASRNMWTSLKIPYFSFKSGDINLPDLTKELISGQLDLNLSKIIQNLLGSIFNETDGNNTTEEDNSAEAFGFMSSLKLRKIKKAFKNKMGNSRIVDISRSKSNNNPHYQEYDDYDYGYDDDEEEEDVCDKDLYPNANFFSFMFSNSSNINCGTVNDALGQLLSYIFITAPLLIIFILAFIFYIVFCFGRCCCFRAKERTDPGIVSIVFFAVFTTFMVINIAFSFTASAYMYKIVSYVFKSDFQHEIESVCQQIDPSLSEGMQKTVDKLIPSIESISNETVTTIDLSLPQLMGILNYTRDNLTDLLNFMKDLQSFTTDAKKGADDDEKAFNLCKNNHGNHKQGKCQLDDVELINKIYDDNQNGDINNELDSALGNISDIMNITSFIDTGKETIVDSISGIRDSVNDLGNFSIIEPSKCDLSDTFSFFNDLPSFIVPVAGLILFLTPIIMTITLGFQAFSFWTKNCCSRCCSLCCFPCCFCAWCQFFAGFTTTFCCVAVIFVNIIYDQGDDAFDTLVKQITNENREIDFGSLNLSSVTDNVIGSFPLETIQLRKIEFVKNFIDAKLDSSFSQILSLNQLPFDEIANMIEHSLTNAANSTNLNELIVKPVRDLINETSSILPGDDLKEIADMDEMNKQLDEIGDYVDECYDNCKDPLFNKLSNTYNTFIEDFNGKIDVFENKRSNVDTVLKNVPDQVSVYANDLFGGLLKSFGKSLASTFRTIVPAFNDLDVKWLIGAFNIIRVRFMYNFLTAALFMSVVSHLYIIGMCAMTVILWVRHKGMAKEGTTENGEDSTGEDSDTDNNDDNNNGNQPNDQQATQNNQQYDPQALYYSTPYDQPYNPQPPPPQQFPTQPRGMMIIKKSKVENSNDDDDDDEEDDYSLSSESYNTKKSTSGKQKIENDHNSDSEQQSPNDSLNEIVDNGITFDDPNADPENPNDNFLNPYNLPENPLLSAENNDASSTEDEKESLNERSVDDEKKSTQEQPVEKENEQQTLNPLESVIGGTSNLLEETPEQQIAPTEEEHHEPVGEQPEQQLEETMPLNDEPSEQQILGMIPPVEADQPVPEQPEQPDENVFENANGLLGQEPADVENEQSAEEPPDETMSLNEEPPDETMPVNEEPPDETMSLNEEPSEQPNEGVLDNVVGFLGEMPAEG